MRVQAGATFALVWLVACARGAEAPAPAAAPTAQPAPPHAPDEVRDAGPEVGTDLAPDEGPDGGGAPTGDPARRATAAGGLRDAPEGGHLRKNSDGSCTWWPSHCDDKPCTPTTMRVRCPVPFEPR